MAPNLYLAVRKAVTPHTWFKRHSSLKHPQEFHADEPVPGIYTFQSLRGLCLVAKDSDNGVRLPEPIPVKRSRATGKYYLKPEYKERVTYDYIVSPDGDLKMVMLFRLDDGVSYVACEDENGNHIPGPYAKYCIDKDTKRFRLMLKGDCPEWQLRKNSTKSTFSGSDTLCVPNRQDEPVAEFNTPFTEPNSRATSAAPSAAPSVAPSAAPSAAPSIRNFPTSSTRAPTPDSGIISSPVTPGNGPIPGNMDQMLIPELDRKLAELKQPHVEVS